jgi:hypothetical protein
MRKSEVAKKYFDVNVTDRERAAFEVGIALASIYHQFVGTPISLRGNSIKALEKTIEETIKLQPYKEKVKVRVETNRLKQRRGSLYSYETLKGEHLNVEVEAKYRRAKVKARMKYIPELQYNLMYVQKISG